MYSYMKGNNQYDITANGIKKEVIKKDVKHEDYKGALFNNKPMSHKMRTIRSNEHEIASYELNKISLSCVDDKRYINDNGQTSLAYGHSSLRVLKRRIRCLIRFRCSFVKTDYKKKVSQALVKWKRYGDDFNSWVPLKDLQSI